jgi:hypothetical protein
MSCTIGGSPPVIPGQLPRDALHQRRLMEEFLEHQREQQNSPKMQNEKPKSRSRRRRFAGGTGLETAVVPFGLLAVQQWFGTRGVKSRNVKSIKNKTMKNKSRKNKSIKNKSRKNNRRK